MLEKKADIDKTRKVFDSNDDKITKSTVKGLEEEPLGDADDDVDMDVRTFGGKSTGKSSGR